MERIEGSGASQLVQLIRAIGYNSEITFELATVTSEPPQLKIKVDHMNVELEKDDLIVAQSLAKHTRTINLKCEGGTKIYADIKKIKTPPYQFSLSHLYGGTGKLEFFGVNIAAADQTVEEAELEFTDLLKKDDRVIVVGINQGQTYIILDRAVMY